jgi:RND family efflux transporter MFP subunit
VSETDHPLIADKAEPNLPAVLRNEADQAAAEARSSHHGARLVGLAACVILAAAIGYGAGRHAFQADEVAVAAEQQRDFAPPVRVAPVQPTSANTNVTLPATISAFDTANIYARVNGYITKRNVDIGDHLTKGQELALIDPRPYQAALDQAKAQLLHDQGVLAEAQMDLKRYQTLENQKSIAAQTSQDQVYVVQQDQGTVQLDQANVETAQLNLDWCHITAPFDGVVTQRNVDIGDLVEADTTTSTFMFTVMHRDVARIFVYVPQSEAVGIAPGVGAVLRLQEMPNRTFPGTVTRTADALQPGTRTLLTEIDIPNPDGTLSPGMYGTVELDIPRKTPAVVVSSDAIIFNQDGVNVAVVENGVAHLHKIDIARDFGTDVQVSDGLKLGDQVILDPPAGLTDGTKVRIQPQPPSQVT